MRNICPNCALPCREEINHVEGTVRLWCPRCGWRKKPGYQRTIREQLGARLIEKDAVNEFINENIKPIRRE